jgi:hypothetical protein
MTSATPLLVRRNDPYTRIALPPPFKWLFPHGPSCGCHICDWSTRQTFTPPLVRVFVGQFPRNWVSQNGFSMLLQLLYVESGALLWLQPQFCDSTRASQAVFGSIKIFVDTAVVHRVLSLHHRVVVWEGGYWVLGKDEAPLPGSTLLVAELSKKCSATGAPPPYGVTSLTSRMVSDFNFS